LYIVYVVHDFMLNI